MIKFEGLIAAPFTAMHPDGSLNLDRIEQQAGHLLATGVRGAFVCGTTGEGASLTLQERFAVAARWVEVAGRDLSVIVHTGCNCLADCRALAAHAQKVGAFATAAMPPSFFKPATVVDLAECCAQIAAAAPGIPFYYYHIPSMTGVNFAMAQLLPVAGKRIANFAGVKFTCENLMDYAQAFALDGGRFDMLFGRDELLLAGLGMGARGAVGSTYNYSAAIYLRVMAAFAAGDLAEARRQQAMAVESVALMLKYGGLPAGKAIMNMVGVDCGPVRLPLRTLSPEQQKSLRTDLDEAGFFDNVCIPVTHAV